VLYAASFETGTFFPSALPIAFSAIANIELDLKIEPESNRRTERLLAAKRKRSSLGSRTLARRRVQREIGSPAVLRRLIL
jgi:hypothetical protein